MALPRTVAAVEAGWQYFIVCGMALGLALFGVVVLATAALLTLGPGWAAMSWSGLARAAPGAQPALLIAQGSRRPYRPFVILEERENVVSLSFRVAGQFAILPTGKTLVGANPKPAVVRGQHASNPPAGEMLITRRLPFDGAHTIESNQAEFGTQPEVTIAGLRDGVYRAFEESVAHRPRRVSVLVNVEGWI